MEPRKPYPTDLTDDEWALLEPYVPIAKRGGRPEHYPKREILNGIFYIVRGGCAWRLLPHDFPPWQIVYHYFWIWRQDGTWPLMHDLLRGDVRVASGKHRQPSAGIIDSQSVKTTEKGGVRGFDTHKQVKGRKRHLFVDTLGLLLTVVVTAASVQDRDGAKSLLKGLRRQFSRLRLIWADGAYGGELLAWVWALRPWRKVRLEIVKRPKGVKGFQLLPWRWIVERTFGWLGRYRRLSKDYEYLTQTSEAMICVAMIHLMVRRLARLTSF